MEIHTHGSQTYVQKEWLIVLVNIGYSFNVHAWLPLYMAIWIVIMKNTNAPSEGWKVDSWLVITWLYCANLQVFITWSITASMHKFGAEGLTMGNTRLLKFKLFILSNVIKLCLDFSDAKFDFAIQLSL